MSIRCRHCYGKGHNVRSCKKLEEQVKNNPTCYYALKYDNLFDKDGNKKKAKDSKSCSYCKEPGHTRRTCNTKMMDLVHNIKTNAEYRQDWLAFMKSKGMGVGALISVYNNQYLVTGFNFDNVICQQGNAREVTIMPVSEHSYYNAISVGPWEIKNFDLHYIVESPSDHFPEPNEEWKKGMTQYFSNYIGKVENPFRNR